jgi:hypothetical protein
MLKVMRSLGAMVAATVLAGCETAYTTQRYAISVDNSEVIRRTLKNTEIGISPFTGPLTAFDAQCRIGAPLRVADGLSHTQYIQKAFEDELKVARAFSSTKTPISLQGHVRHLEFSTTIVGKGGSWGIYFVLTSSNGSQLYLDEYYTFDTGYLATEACRNAAEAFPRAVQNLIRQTFSHADFPSLLIPR